MAAVLGGAIGRQVDFEVQPMAEVEAMGPEMVLFYEWLTAGGYSADADRLAKDLPNVHFTPYKEWADAQDWTALLGAVNAA